MANITMYLDFISLMPTSHLNKSAEGYMTEPRLPIGLFYLLDY